MQQQSDPLAELAFYAGIAVGGYFLVLKLLSLIWSAALQLWQPFVLFCAVLINLFCTYKAVSSLPRNMRCDVSLEGIEDGDMIDDVLQKSEPARVQPASVPQEKPKREVHIDTNALLSKAVHRHDFLIPEEYEYLIRNGYEPKQFVPFGEMHAQPFLIKRNGVESDEHIFVVNMIADELRRYTKKARIYLTQYPDIIFECKGKEYAIEVETPFGLPKKHRRLAKKAEENNKKYGSRWIIVVTQSAYAKCFKRYTKVLRRNEVATWIEQLFARRRPQYSVPQNRHLGRAKIDDNRQKSPGVPVTNEARQD